MGTLNLTGTLDLSGTLVLRDKVTVDGTEALVEVVAPSAAAQGTAPPVILPPPPAAPLDPGTDVWVVSSFGKTVTAGQRPLVTQGMAMQGTVPTWPGMVLPSKKNTTVLANKVAVNVLGDQAVIFPSGGTATFSKGSGQS